MSRVLGRTIEEIRREFGVPMLPRRAVATVVHEAAHATIALAHGTEVTEVYVRASDPTDGSTWYGKCHYSTFGVDRTEEREIIAAGIASSFLLGPLIEADRWKGSDDDIQALERLGVTGDQVWECIDATRLRLKANRDVLDGIASELLTMRDGYTMGHLTEADVRAIATPGMSPSHSKAPSDFTRAQLRKMADWIESAYKNGTLPPALSAKLSAPMVDRTTQYTPPTASGAIRYGDPVYASPRSIDGYEHRIHPMGTRLNTRR